MTGAVCRVNPRTFGPHRMPVTIKPTTGGTRQAREIEGTTSNAVTTIMNRTSGGSFSIRPGRSPALPMESGSVTSTTGSAALDVDVDADVEVDAAGLDVAPPAAASS